MTRRPVKLLHNPYVKHDESVSQFPALVNGKFVAGWISDIGCWMLDIGCWISDIGSQIIYNLKSEIPNPKSSLVTRHSSLLLITTDAARIRGKTCNYAIMLRHMMVHEEGDELHLLKAIPDWWLADGQQIRLENLPTWFGNLSLIITGTATGVDVKFEGPNREKPAKIILHLPENRPLLNPVPGVTVETRKPQSTRWDYEKVVGLYTNRR